MFSSPRSAVLSLDVDHVYIQTPRRPQRTARRYSRTATCERRVRANGRTDRVSDQSVGLSSVCVLVRSLLCRLLRSIRHHLYRSATKLRKPGTSKRRAGGTCPLIGQEVVCHGHELTACPCCTRWYPRASPPPPPPATPLHAPLTTCKPAPSRHPASVRSVAGLQPFLTGVNTAQLVTKRT